MHQSFKVCTTVEKKNREVTGLGFCFEGSPPFLRGVLLGDPPPSPVLNHSARARGGGGGGAGAGRAPFQARPRAESGIRRFTPGKTLKKLDLGIYRRFP